MTFWEITHLNSTNPLWFLSTGPCTDSPMIGVLCGNDEMVLQDSSGLYVLLEFSTDTSVRYRGFEMEFYIGIQ